MKKSTKNLLIFSTSLIILGIASIAFADSELSEAAAKQIKGGWIAIAAGLGLGLAAFGGALGQAKAAAAALEGIARNPSAADKLFTPMILGLALIESLVIYALIIAILLQGKI